MSAVSPPVEISAVAVAIFALGDNEEPEVQESEDEQSGIFVSWLLTT